MFVADRRQRLPNNAPGDFFVDVRCIDCDACRQLAPEVFAAERSYSAVIRQPTSQNEIRNAIRAMLACPTGSIGSARKVNPGAVIADFPLHLADGVYYCGFNSPKSFGGNSYFVTHPDGNWLIDSPRWTHHLIREFEKLGGIHYIFLTHRNDVADAEKYAVHFGSQRIIHRLELHAQPRSEFVVEGEQLLAVHPEFLVLPTPGHTRGHCCLLYANRFLFTGDHLEWDRDEQRLCASRDHCWYSWTEQTRSMVKLANYSFEWILPGHGQRVKLGCDSMRAQLQRLIPQMQSG